MKDDKYIRAKELFAHKYYDIKYFNEEEKREWDLYCVPEEVVISWIIEYIDNLIKEEKLLVEDNQITSDYNKITSLGINMSIILKETYKYKLDYDKEIVDLFLLIEKKHLIVKLLTTLGFMDRLCFDISYLICDKEKDKDYLLFNAMYYYDADDKYIGFLPHLYMKNHCLFKELFVVIYKYLNEYECLNMVKGFDVTTLFKEYAKYKNIDYKSIIANI